MSNLLKKFSRNDRKHGTKRSSRKIAYASGATQNQEVCITTTRYKVACCQSPGKERSHNEDTLFTLNSFLGELDSPVAFGIFLVADGMGGHQSGELASNLAAQGIIQYLMDHVYHASLFERKTFSQQDLEQTIQDAVAAAQTLVLQRVPGGGTTLTFVLAFGDEMYSAHVGDSRLYLLGSDGSLVLKTRDHSLVKRLVDLGEISEHEAGLLPQRNILYRALGQSDPFEPDIEAFSLKIGQRILICSDGLWGVVNQQDMIKIITEHEDLNEMALALVHAANEAGGPDNISVVLVERIG